MPPVGHARGEIPEEFQPKSDARSARFAVISCALALLVFGAWIGFVQIRQVIRKRAMRNAVCCGCGQQHGTVPCGKTGTCPTPNSGSAGCRSH